ncbi:MAG: phytanoyl-CoA dioxygenase family protein [Pseudomonadota bacterium]
MFSIPELQDRIAVADAVGAVRADGVHFLPGLLSADTLLGLQQDWKTAFGSTGPGVHPSRHPPGRMITLDMQQLAPDACPALRALFGAQVFDAIARGLNPQWRGPGQRVSLTHEYEAVPITDLHFDAVRSLKFLVYLRDTDVANGAFGYLKGSHRENTSYRETYLSAGGHLLDLQNVSETPAFDDPAIEWLPGPAGSLIVFDTDGWHAAGCLAKGRERQVVRSRSVFPGQPALWPRRWTPQWLCRKLGVFHPRPPFELPGRRRSAGTSRKA